MKKKIGDLTLKEVKKALDECQKRIDCKGCIFETITNCLDGFLEFPERFSLDQEIEVEENV